MLDSRGDSLGALAPGKSALLVAWLPQALCGTIPP